MRTQQTFSEDKYERAAFFPPKHDYAESLPDTVLSMGDRHRCTNPYGDSPCSSTGSHD